jgi:hypothetical protein
MMTRNNEEKTHSPVDGPGNRPRFLDKLQGSRALRWYVGIPAALALLLYAASFFLDEPLRRKLEGRMNSHLIGYSVKLPGLHLSLIGLSITLKGLTVLQLAHPEPPVLYFPVLKASILWSEVFSGKLVAAFVLDSPSININLQQLQSEAASTVKLKEQGWQQAVQEIYPLKINTLKVRDASVTYINRDPTKPLVLSHLNLQATNIRNIHSPDQVYPSSFHLDTAILGSGHGSIDGRANFLGEPYPGIKGRVQLTTVPVDNLKPLLAGSSFTIEGGVLGASGNAEYGPKVKLAHLEKLTVQGMKVDYLHSRATAVVEKKRVAVVGETARKLANKPSLLVRADQVNLTGCNFGMVSRTPHKPYRLFIADADLELKNFSNQFSQGPAQARLTGKFMGSGSAAATLDFRPQQAGLDLDLHLKVDETRMTSLNDLLRAYGNFDVSAGIFSLVTELHIKKDALTGYLKPFFKDMQVYDQRKDKGKPIMHKAYEKLVGAAAWLLQNRPRQEVATRVAVHGSLKNPQTSTWQIVGELFKNAFFEALLPGFDKTPTGTAKR